MVMGNGRDHTFRSKYDKPNRYEEDRAKSSPPRAPAAISPAPIPRIELDEFQPRNLPSASIYIPAIGETRRGRREARQLIEDLRIAGQVHQAATGYEETLTKLEETHQQRELAQLRRRQLPAKIEAENLSIAGAVVTARSAFAATVERQQDELTDRERTRQIDREDFETLLSSRRAARLEAQAREKANEEYLGHAAEIGKRRAEAEKHKAAQKAHRRAADAEAERRRHDHERQKRNQARQSDGAEMPEALAMHFATERKVQTARKRAEELAEGIRQRARAAGREPTDVEAEEIQALYDAAAGAEDTIRRGDATDLDV